MKNLFLISAFFILFSCISDDNMRTASSKKIQYRIIDFYSLDNISVDLNNDGIKNIDIMLEVDYYFDNNFYYHDLEEIRGMNTTKKGKVTETGERFFDVVLPIQYFYPNNINPFSSFSFERSVYIIHLNMDKDNIYQSIYIDDENSVLQFEKTSETQYEAIIEKKYYDFATSSNTRNWYKIVYEKM